MTEEDIIALLDQWDKLDEAAKRVIVSQPAAMTEAAARMDRERKVMGAMIRTLTRSTRAAV
jgi:hypothetical protein